MRSIRLLIIASLVISAIVAGTVYAHVSNTEKRLLAELEPTKVLIATSDVEPGTTRGNLVALTKEIVIPKRSFPDGAVATTTDLPSDYVALTRIVAGTYIFRDAFGPGSRLVGGLVVPEGRVVLTVNLAEQARIGKFVRPGATVAVYSTDDAGTSSLIVPDASVLAIGDDTSVNADASGSSLVTLALDPEAAKRLLAAQRKGTIQLALLGQGVDTSAEGNAGVGR